MWVLHATSCMYYGDMARNLDFEIKSLVFTSYYLQARDSPPGMTSPTVRTVSGSCSARGAHRVPSPSQVSNIVIRGTRQTDSASNYLTQARMVKGCMLWSSLFISPFSYCFLPLISIQDCLTLYKQTFLHDDIMFSFLCLHFLDVRYRGHEVYFI